MNADVLQYIGFVASVIIALSMTMNSILKFRWINLVGAITFSTYGFLIGAYPVGLLNAFIVSVDVYYLVRIYTRKDFFDILEIRNDNRYLMKFLDFHRQDIQKFFPGFVYKPEMNSISFFVLRDTQVAGIFLAHRTGGDTMKVVLDYVVPEYRDYRNGRFLYYGLQGSFINAGFRRAIADGISPKHEKYLRRVGFVKAEDGTYVKDFPQGKI
ncbi:MAG TPA: hypothetical protein VFC92_05995 [Bacteroidales bacterium]|nr:hypothetical protein [Bacteroidales bacterium]